MSAVERPVSDNRRDDIVLSYTVESLGVRGRIVRLGPAIDAILRRHAYPEPVARAVAEAAALAALLGSTLKMDGRFQLQTQSNGPVSMLLVDFDAPSNLRALARYDEAAVERAVESRADMLGHGHLAFTIDPGGEMSRYQGVVALDGQGLEKAAHEYFERSEQIPTLARIAVGQSVTAEGSAWRAGALIAQYLPKSGVAQRDFPPGDAPEGAVLEEVEEDDAWLEAKARAGSTEAHELIDPAVSSERLLFRLFNERGVRVFEPTPLNDACRCSADRIDTMLRSFSPQERRDMVGDDGLIGVTCEFCSVKRVFDPRDYEA